MSIPVLPTTDVKFVAGTIGLFGAAPGAAHLSEFKAFNANPEVTMTTLADLVEKDAAKLAAVVVANLGLTGAAATAGTAYLTGEFKANPTNHGKVIIDALLSLTTLTADATFGTAATAVTTMINKGAAYSAVSTNTSKDLTVLKAAIAAGAVNEGVIGVDSGKFTATNDTVTVSATTLNAGDTFVDPSTLDNDVLTLNLQGNVQNPLLGTRFVNIETMAINVAGLLGAELVANGGLTNGANLDFASQTQTTGLKTINVSGDSRGSLGLLSVRDEVSRVDASAMSDDQTDVDGIHLTFGANINATGTATARTILGSQGRDSIVSTGGADTISGNAGNDTINGGAGNDTIDGGAGNDRLMGGTGNDSITGGAGNDLIFANGDTRDTVNLNSGADSLDGGDGNDFIQVSQGATAASVTSVAGGTGNDFIDLAGVTGGLSVNGNDDNDQVLIRNTAGQVFTADFVANGLEGGNGGTDALTILSDVADSAIANAINRATGFEQIRVVNSMTVATVNSTTANTGTAFTNDGQVLFNATLAAAHDVLIGTTTQAVIVDVSANVVAETFNIVTGTGNDTVTGGANADTISTGAGSDSVLAGLGNDVVIGGLGADVLDGQGGTDTVSYAGSAAAMTVSLATNSAVNSAAGNGGDGDDVLANFENIIGSSFGDTLTGDTAANNINGGGGNDTITGGAGADVVSGGTGTNTFVFAAGANGAAPSATVFDTITDFGTNNVIDFGATAITIGDQGTVAGAGVATISAAGVATFNPADTTLAQHLTAVAAAIVTVGATVAGESAIWQEGANAYLFISDNVNGVSANDVLIQLTGVTVAAGGLTIVGGDITAIA